MRVFFLTLIMAGLGAMNVAHGAGCPPVTQVTPNTGQIHTEVYDVPLGKLRSIYYARTYTKGGDFYLVMGTSKNCPARLRCGDDPPGQIQDCTSTASPQMFFDWAVVHNGTQISTTAEALSIKNPSGALVLNQRAGGTIGSSGGPCNPLNIASGRPAIHTEVVDKDSNVGLKVVSVRVYAKTHPGSSDVDFYMVIGVDSGITFTPDPPQSQDCTTPTTNQQGWYDLYWAISTQDGHDVVHTVSEAIVVENNAVLQLNQGF